MKTARQTGSATVRERTSETASFRGGSSRANWSETVETAPVRAPGRGLSDPPVRPLPGWRLPSGQLLVEYALRGGLASSPLLVRLPLLGGSAGSAGAVARASLSSLATKVNTPRRDVGRATTLRGTQKSATLPKVSIGGRS